MPSEVADAIGYLHLQGNRKWDESTITWIKEKLKKFNRPLYNMADVVSRIAFKSIS
jgi:hypothetical protein